MTLITEAISIGRTSVLGGLDLVQARFVSRGTPRHSHRELEVGLVMSGRRLVRWRGKEYLAPSGSVLVFGPGEVHAGAPADVAGSSYRAFLIPTESLVPHEAWTGDRRQPWLESPVLRDSLLFRRLAGLHRAMSAGEAGRSIETGLVDAVERLTTRHLARVKRRGAAAHPATVPVRAYLEAHYADRIRLDTLADLSGISVCYLSRVFRAATGLAPYAWLEQLRVHRAAELLRGGLPASQVACRTGFADQSHLTRLFKRLVGVPPGEYQRGIVRRGVPAHVPMAESF